MLLEDKVCVVVGSGSERGIGNATVELFAEHGAKVVAVDRVFEEANDGSVGLGASRAAVPRHPVVRRNCDITDRNACRQLFEWVADQHGTLDSLVNCAGIVSASGMLEIEEAEYLRVVDTNLRGTFNLCQAALERFRDQRNWNIVNVASAAAQRGGGLLGGPHYAAAKGGVISLTRAIAREFGPSGIRANVVCPAMIGTRMLDQFSQAQLQEILSAIPLRRSGSASEAAGACLFLASELSGYVTGATLDVNGGSHIH